MNKNQNESVQQAADRPKTLRIVLSIVIAFFVWMAAMLAAPEITKAIRDVPITVDIPTSAMLEVVDGADTKVSLVLDGKQFEIGSYGPENVRVVADASAITEPGTYEVPLVVSEDGRRLAKRHGDTRICAFRRAGLPPEKIIGLLAWWCGWAAWGERLTLRDLLPRFDLRALPRGPAVLTRQVKDALGVIG